VVGLVEEGDVLAQDVAERLVAKFAAEALRRPAERAVLGDLREGGDDGDDEGVEGVAVGVVAELDRVGERERLDRAAEDDGVDRVWRSA